MEPWRAGVATAHGQLNAIVSVPSARLGVAKAGFRSPAKMQKSQMSARAANADNPVS